MEPINEANVSKKGKRVAPGSNHLWVIPLAIFGVLAAAYVGLCAYAGTLNTFYPHTQMNGIDVGGLTQAQAQQKLMQEFPAKVLTLTSNGKTLAEPTYAQLGYTDSSLSEPVQITMTHLLRQGFFARGGAYLRAVTGHETHYFFIPQQEDAIYSAYAMELAEALHIPEQNADYTLTDEGKLMATIPMNGRKVDELALHTALQSAVNEGSSSVEIPFTTLPAKVITAQSMHNDLFSEMKNASYDSETKSIVPEQMGADFDVAQVQSLLDSAEPGSTVELPAAIVYPEVTAQALEKVLFRDVLGQARTKVSGTAARQNNVRLASASFNGRVLNSGDVFSYNQSTGQRTLAAGYLPAPAYIAGETVDEVGGGVCQPSSTLYLACLLADMEIVERTNHRYVPSYIDWGMDATVSWGTLDYKFANNTKYPVKLVSSYENGYLTVKILGTNETGKTTKMTNKVLSSTPWETIYKVDPTMAPGSPDVVKSTPYTGYKVETYHTIYDAAGNVVDTHLEARSNYSVRNKVILQAPPSPDTPAVAPVPPAVPVQGDAHAEDVPPVVEVPAEPEPSTDVTFDEGSIGIL